MSRSTILVDDFRTSFLHAGGECVQKAGGGGKVVPGGEKGFTKGISHSLW